MNIVTVVTAFGVVVATSVPTSVLAAGKAATDGQKGASVLWILAGVILVTTVAVNLKAMRNNSGDRMPWWFAFGWIGVAAWISLTNSFYGY